MLSVILLNMYFCYELEVRALEILAGTKESRHDHPSCSVQLLSKLLEAGRENLAGRPVSEEERVKVFNLGVPGHHRLHLGIVRVPVQSGPAGEEVPGGNHTLSVASIYACDGFYLFIIRSQKLLNSRTSKSILSKMLSMSSLSPSDIRSSVIFKPLKNGIISSLKTISNSLCLSMYILLNPSTVA